MDLALKLISLLQNPLEQVVFCNLKYKCNNAVWEQLSLKELH